MDIDIIKAAMELARKSARDETGSKLFGSKAKKPDLVIISKDDEKPELDESPAEEAAESPDIEGHEELEEESPLRQAIAHIMKNHKG